MTEFVQHTIESAPEASKPLLEATLSEWNFIPALHATLAESPAALGGYRSLFELAAQSSFGAAELQAIYLAVNVYHGCEYCTAGHTYLARTAGLPEDAIQALRAGQPIADARLQALRSFTETVVHERGRVGDGAVERFLAAGFSKAQVLEVVLVVATKTISNYTNHITHTPKESFMSDPGLAWHAPERQAA